MKCQTGFTLLELMIVVTPHVLANFNRTTPEIWVTEK